MPIMYLIQKEVDVYHRVPGSSGQETDLFAFGEHPTHRVTPEKKFGLNITEISSLGRFSGFVRNVGL